MKRNNPKTDKKKTTEEQLEYYKERVARFKDRREQLGINLRDLSAKTREYHPKGCSISTSQISRIENGTIEPSFTEIVILCNVLDLSPNDVLGTQDQPWFVIRAGKAEQRLSEVREDKSKIKRRGAAHEYLIEKGVYRYIPLANNNLLVEEGETGKAKFVPLIRKFLFEVGRAQEEDIKQGLDSHTGEETIYVLDGEMEFWYRQSLNHPPKNLTLRKDDCLHFSSELLHGFRAAGTTERAKALFVLAEISTSDPFRMP